MRYWLCSTTLRNSGWGDLDNRSSTSREPQASVSSGEAWVRDASMRPKPGSTSCIFGSTLRSHAATSGAAWASTSLAALRPSESAGPVRATA